MCPKLIDKNSKNEEILNFNAVKKEQIEKKRRSYERVLFQNVLGAFSVMEDKGLHAIELIDISEGGLSFQLPKSSERQFEEGSVLKLRLYFSTESYIPVDIKVVHRVDKVDEGTAVCHYGCIMDKTLASYQAVLHFIHFIASCAEHAKEDKDHFKIFY